MEEYYLTEKGDISNHLGLNIKNNLDKKKSRKHLVDKIIIHVGTTVSVIIKCKETMLGKVILHEYGSGITIKCDCNYRI